jgi:hypothetical protein
VLSVDAQTSFERIKKLEENLRLETKCKELATQRLATAQVQLASASSQAAALSAEVKTLKEAEKKLEGKLADVTKVLGEAAVVKTWRWWLGCDGGWVVVVVVVVVVVAHPSPCLFLCRFSRRESSSSEAPGRRARASASSWELARHLERNRKRASSAVQVPCGTARWLLG